MFWSVKRSQLSFGALRMPARRLLIVAAVIAGASSAAAQCNIALLDDLQPILPEGSMFGSAIAVSGNTIVVGAPLASTSAAGLVWVLTLTGSTVDIQQVLTADDAAADEWFGFSVAISGDTIVVGAAREDNAGGADAGAAYVFVRSGTTWTQQAKLLASDRSAADYFGNSVGINGNAIVVGAPRDDNVNGTDAGAAYVFNRSGTEWTQQTKLLPVIGSSSDFFGEHVAINTLGIRRVIAAGAETASSFTGVDTGVVHIFTLNTVTPGSTWQQAPRVVASDGAAADYFGSAVALSGSTLVVGAFGDNNSGGTDAGAAYVFTSDPTGSSWTQQAKLLASDRAPGDAFGRSVSISGDTVVVGASLDDNSGGSDAGSAYVYRNALGIWLELDRIQGPTGENNDYFGSGVALSGDVLAVGASGDNNLFAPNIGAAYAFDARHVTFSQQPASTSVCPSGAASFTFSLTGAGAITVQWQYMGGPTGETTWRDIANGSNTRANNYLFNASGATGGTLLVQRNSPPSGPSGWDPLAPRFQFRAVISDACNGLTSAAAILTICAADYNCSGALSVQDIFDFLAGYFGGAAAADFNNSGTISVQDIFDFLAAYFAGCP